MISIGVDVGGTYVKFFAVNKKGKIIKSHKLETDVSKGPAHFLKQIGDFVNSWKGDFKGEKIVMGVGLPGDVDNKKGVLRFGTNLKFKNKNIKDIPFKESLRKQTGITPVVANDATLAAWGIYELQLKKKYENVAVIAMGTGIGGGLILNGTLFQGSHGVAGEIGHIKLSTDPKAPKCGCGARGCLEAYAGTYAIHRLVKEEILLNPKSYLAALVGNAKRFKIALVSEAAAKGCKSALKVWQQVGTSVAVGIAAIALILDVDAVVLAGGVSRGHKYFMPALKKRLAKEKIVTPFKELKIFTSEIPEVGGLGAALYAINQSNGK